jgi:hypothetical protein
MVEGGERAQRAGRVKYGGKEFHYIVPDGFFSHHCRPDRPLDQGAECFKLETLSSVGTVLYVTSFAIDEVALQWRLDKNRGAHGSKTAL